MPDYPAPPVRANHVEPVPRRIRAVLAGKTVVDTTAARYVWEWPPFPQYYVPLADVRARRPRRRAGDRGDTPRRRQAVRAYASATSSAAGGGTVLGAAKVDGLDDTVRFEWSALDAWYEEDEQVFVHPRSPYSRVDAMRSTRTVRVESHGVVLAESSSPVLCFETGLPTRYYLNRTDIDFTHLVPTETADRVPLQGRHHRLLVVGDRGPHAPGHRLGLRLPDPRPAARSPASWPSTTRRSTSSSTVWNSSDRRPTSREPQAPARSVLGYLVPSTGLSTSPV